MPLVLSQNQSLLNRHIPEGANVDSIRRLQAPVDSTMEAANRLRQPALVFGSLLAERYLLDSSRP